MKSIILVALAFVAIAAAAPADQKPAVEILEYSSESQPDGSYYFKFKADDGTSRQEKGVVKEVLDEENKLQRVIVVEGSYTFLDEQGIPDTIIYSADENGYRAEGKSIPKNV